MIIQAILIPAVLVVAWTLFRGPGSVTQRALRRISAGLLSVAGAAFIVFPDSLTSVANLLGVGRGADLLLYAAVVFFGFVVVALLQRISLLERRVVALTREIALRSTVHSSHRE